MAVRSDARQWVRKLDGDMHIVPEQPQRRYYPEGLAHLVEAFDLARNPPLGGTKQARACGSHWAASKTAVSPGAMIETASPVHEADGDQSAPRLNHVLYNVVPACLTDAANRFFDSQNVQKFDPSMTLDFTKIYLFHVEAGMRIYELYSRLDGDDALVPDSLANAVRKRGSQSDYSGPWALETMGGAGGQTIAGVVSTATHGGDQDYGAIGDAVLAVHLIDATGQHHWIERPTPRPTASPLQLVDPSLLEQVHPGIRYHSDNELLNAVIVSCGRMGLIYSLVLRVVRQYALKQWCERRQWNDIKVLLANPSDPVFTQNRFVRIDVNAYGSLWDPSTYQCYIITRTLKPLSDAGIPPLGRAERSGANAGKASTLGKSEDGWLSNPCASDNWIRLVLGRIRHSFVEIRDDAIKVWLVASAAIAFPLTPPPLKIAAIAVQASATGTIVFMEGLILWVTLVIELIESETYTFGDALAVVANYCALNDLFWLFRAIYEYTSDLEHEIYSKNTPAISYATMDEHDYRNVGCVAPGDTIEFFLDADSPQLPAFIDNALSRIRDLEFGALGGAPQAFGGYISLRFMSPSDGLIAMQRWKRTCSIEIAGLSRIPGTESYLRTLEEDSRKFGAILHWGQRNNWTQSEVEQHYIPAGPNGELFKWRKALSDLTDHGRFDLFSTAFSKLKGLEITTPITQDFWIAPTDACADEPVTVTWNAISNPPETVAFVVHTPEGGAPERIALGGLSGTRQITIGPGRSEAKLVLERELNRNVYIDERRIKLKGYATGDFINFVMVAEPRIIDGINRWTVEINLYSQFISDTLRVIEIKASFGAVAAWRMRNLEAGDIAFTISTGIQSLPSKPLYNTNWLFFSENQVSGGIAPTMQVRFTIDCQQ
jgi:hypothetical protein